MKPTHHSLIQEKKGNNGLLHIIKKDFFSLPISIRIVSFSLFLFILGWGLGADAFFSLYIKSITNNILLVSFLGALMPISRMIFSLPIGNLDNHTNLKSVIFISKIFYVISGFLYYFAGVYQSIWILVFAVVFNGFASAGLFTSYETYVRLETSKKNNSTSFGLYFSSANLAYVIGALLSAIFIQFIDLHYLYLFIVLFSVVSLLIDKRLPLPKKLKFYLGDLEFLKQFFREAFAFRVIRDVFGSLKNFSHKLKKPIFFEFLFNALNYIGFIFIPLVAVNNNLSLSQVALIFGIMRLPYLSNFFITELLKGHSKKKIILLLFLFLSLLFGLLSFNEGFGSIIIISFGIAISLSIMRPLISALISDYTTPKMTGTISGIQGFVAMLGNIFGTLFFGFLSEIFGLSGSFLFVGILVFLLSIYIFLDKMIKSITHHDS